MKFVVYRGLIYSFVVGAAKAITQLLFSIALLLVLLAPVSLVLSMISDTTMSLWWIDLIAMVFALAFLRFYQQAKSRQNHAQVGSIWY